MNSEVHGSLHKIKKCWLGLHNWTLVYIRGKWDYYQCDKCGWRKAVKNNSGGSMSLDHTWLDRIGE